MPTHRSACPHRHNDQPLTACITVLAVFLLPSCTSEPPDLTPLIGADQGLVEIAWGESPAPSLEKMLRLPDLAEMPDTAIVLTDEPLFISPDSVLPPRLGDLSYRIVRFSGGTFLGNAVDEWQLWFADETHLRNVDILFAPSLPTDELYEDLGNKLLVVYGVPERGGVVWKKYRSRDWSQRHVAGEDPETGALLTWGRIPGRVTLSYHDLAYTDSLEQVPYGEPISLDVWNARKAGQ